MPSPTADPSVLSVLQTIQERFPDVPFLALGQTVFWDEPMKAVWRLLLDRHLPEAHLVAGVHDTDYFAKTSAHIEDTRKYVALPHDDGRTRDLWSAAGELSSLFGSESVPTRAMFLAHNIPFDWLGKNYPGGRNALYAAKTEAWGWRGIVHTESHSVIAHDIPVLDIREALLEQLDWGFAESLACLADPEARSRGEALATLVRGWLEEFLSDCSDSCRLSDLYQSLLPRFYRLLLGYSPAHYETTASTQLFRFNRETFARPRFRMIGLFLDPKTRRGARDAYNRAVGGSGIYTLDGFGAGAIPFDLVIPGVGRGTIRIVPAGLVIETAPAPTFLTSTTPITTLEHLSAVVEEEFGLDAVLVGKAVTLADMIASEFLVLFHETASGYTSLTQKMNALLADQGQPLTLYPIIRLTYPTWDSLSASAPETRLRLPKHLSATFGMETIQARDFAARWRKAVSASRQIMRESRDLISIRALLTYLDSKTQTCWCDRLEAYEQALRTLKEIGAQSETLLSRIEEHHEELRVWQAERKELERRKGEDWRHYLQPLRKKLSGCRDQRDASRLQQEIDRQIAIRAIAFDEPIQIAQERINATRHLIAEFRRQRRRLERGPKAAAARAHLHEITYQAQMARLDLIRNAYLTIESLEHTQLRPTAWWLPLVDSSGAWFEALTAGTQARLEMLS